jgi:hypothetical protein
MLKFQKELRFKVITYILFIVFQAQGYKGFNVSEFKSKKACVIALQESKKIYMVYGDQSSCIEVRE